MGRTRGLAESFCKTFRERWPLWSFYWQHSCQSSPTRHWRPKKEGPQAIARSRGGLTTKVHALTDRNGNLVHFCLTPGQAHDLTQAIRLLKGVVYDFVLADKAYDSSQIIDHIEISQAAPIIPPKANRKTKREYDTELYKHRNLIERFFGRLKQFRRVATRFEKLSRRYAAFILLAAGMIVGTFK